MSFTKIIQENPSRTKAVSHVPQPWRSPPIRSCLARLYPPVHHLLCDVRHFNAAAQNQTAARHNDTFANFSIPIEAFSNRNWRKTDSPIVLFLEEIMKHDLLIDILTKGNRVDILYETHLKYNRYFYRFCLDNMNLAEDEAKYVVGILFSSLCSFIATWSAEGKKDSAEQLYRRIRNSFRIIGIMYGS